MSSKNAIQKCPRKQKGRLVVWLHDHDDQPLKKWKVVIEDSSGNTLIKETKVNKYKKPPKKSYADFGKVRRGTYKVYAEGAKSISSHVKTITVEPNNEHRPPNPNTKLRLTVNEITPKIEPMHDEVAVKVNDLDFIPTKVKIYMEQTHAETTYSGTGELTRETDGVELFWDEACTRPLPFSNNKVTLKNRTLRTSPPQVFYAKGIQMGEVGLTLSLSEPSSRFVIIDAPAESTLKVQEISEVTPKIELKKSETFNVSAGGETAPIKVDISLEEKKPQTPYTSDLTLTRENTRVTLYSDPDCQNEVPWDNDSLIIKNSDITNNQTISFYLKGLQDGQVNLTVEAAPGSPAVIVNTTPPERVTIKPTKTVTPKLEMEHPVVPLDQNLKSHLKVGETGPDAAPTFIELFYTEDKSAPAYTKKGKLTRSNANIELFSDPQCANSVAFNGNDLEIPNNAIPGPNRKLRYYVKGVSADKLQLTFSLEADDANSIIAAPAVTREMGVVKTELRVWRYAGSPPALQEMSSTDKVKEGRLIHVQNTDDDHCRARVDVKKLTAAHWPGGTDAYNVVLDASTGGSGEIKLYDVETGGTPKTLPHSIPKADLLSGDVTLWVEGKTATTAFRHLRLDVGIAKGKGAAMRYGDWASFTIVEIDEVKLDGNGIVGQVQHFEKKTDHYRVYINVLGNDRMGRTIKITAKLSQALQGVPLHFMLVPHRDNGKAANSGIDLPEGWDNVAAALKHSDKASPNDALHLSAATDANGKADKELKLSRFGGDVFFPGAYIDQDVPAANHIDGDTSAEHKRKPVLMSDRVVVWRRLWYQTTCKTGFAVPALNAVVTAYQRVKVDLVPPAATLNYDPLTVPGGTIYPDWMFHPGGGVQDAILIGSHNKNNVWNAQNALEPDKPCKVNILVCDYQWDPDGSHTALKEFKLKAARTTGLKMDKPVVHPALSATKNARPEVRARYKDATGSWQTLNLTDYRVFVERSRTSMKEIGVEILPSAPRQPSNNDPMKIRLQVQAADGPYLGESSRGRVLAVFDPGNANDFPDTITHEIGHSVGQTPQGAQTNGIPEHPNWFTGMGTHCKAFSKNCVMYESDGSKHPLHRFCDKCHPYLLVRDMTRFV